MRGKGLFAAALVLSLVIFAPGMGNAKPPDRSGQCQSKKVNAASILVKKLFDAEAELLKNEYYNWDQAVQEAEEEFLQRWNEAEATDQCDFPFNSEIDLRGGSSDEQNVSFSTVDDLLAWIEDRTSEIADLIVEQVDDQQPASANLGAEILKAAGRKAFELLKAESQFLNKPNQGKLTRARERAMRSFEDQYTKRVQHALAAGLDVKGFDDDVDPQDGKYDVMVNVEAEIDKLVQNIVTIFTAQSQ